MIFETIPKKSLIIWEILSVFSYGVLFFLCRWLLPDYSIVWYAVLWLIGALFILTSLLYLPLLYLNVRYGISDEKIILKSGVIFQKTYVMMRDKISFVTVYTTPLDYLLGLSGLVISAPGSRLVILFMDAKRAEHIALKLHNSLIADKK